jgi:hypothetical protein
MSKNQDPIVTWETITPELAARLLETSPGNRALRAPSVARWANKMSSGEFEANGETIKIDATGRLRDGHHRLSACVKSGSSIRSLVVRGLDPSVFATVDAGHARYAGDRLAMASEKNANVLAAALIWQRRYEAAAEKMPSRGSCALRDDDVFVALNKHPEMRTMATLAHQFPLLRKLLTPSMLVFSLYNAPNSGEFWHTLENGLGTDAGSVVLLLRNRLLREAMTKAKLPEDENLALVIKAHNSWKTGARTKSLRWRTAESKSGVEMFPRWLS